MSYTQYIQGMHYLSLILTSDRDILCTMRLNYTLSSSYSNVGSRCPAHNAFRLYIILIFFTSNIGSQYSVYNAFRFYIILIFFTSNIGSQYFTYNAFRLYIILVLGGLLPVIFTTAICIPCVSHMHSTGI